MVCEAYIGGRCAASASWLVTAWHDSTPAAGSHVSSRIHTHILMLRQGSLRRITNIYAAVRPFLEGCRVEECTKANSGICRQTRHKFEKVRWLVQLFCTTAAVQSS